MKTIMKTLVTTLLLACTFAAITQTPYKPKALTADDYKKAEKTMGNYVNGLVKNPYHSFTWTDSENF